MNNIYFVYLIDKYYDEHSINIIAIYRDQEEAVVYAQTCNIEHDEIIYVEERCEGVQDKYNPTIYERCCYDHTQALSSMVIYHYYNGEPDYDSGNILTPDKIIAACVRQASPFITEQVDFDKLYTLYTEEYLYEEKD